MVNVQNIKDHEIQTYRKQTDGSQAGGGLGERADKGKGLSSTNWQL